MTDVEKTGITTPGHTIRLPGPISRPALLSLSYPRAVHEATSESNSYRTRVVERGNVPLHNAILSSLSNDPQVPIQEVECFPL